MSLLVLQLPNRTRLHPRASASAQGPNGQIELAYVLSPDGQAIQAEGHCALTLLPKAATVVAVLSPTDTAFHRITCPKAPAARMRAALGGLLEDAVLDDIDTLHLALAPDAKAGEETWVAAMDRAWLTGQLKALENAGVQVDRVVPGLWPDLQAHGHFHTPEESDKPLHVLSWADAQGVGSWPLHGTLSRVLLPEPLSEDTRWTAEPAAAAPAERWLGQPVQVISVAKHMLHCTQSGWNLRQFDLAARHRGMALLRDGWKHFLTPGWRPVRYGLIGLLLAQLVGLNAWAWLQRTEVQNRKTSMVRLLQTAHPNIKAILDAPVQMQRENDMLRTAAGRSSDNDLEPLLEAAASVWPEGRPPQTLRYENGQLTLGAPGVAGPDIDRMRTTLNPAGWQVDDVGGQVMISRPSGARASGSNGAGQGAPR